MSTRRLNDRARVVTLSSGARIAVVDSDIPDAAPPAVREGLARRRIANSGGICPCGAQLVMPNRAQRRRAERTGVPVTVTIEHADGCPAATDILTAAMKAWKGDV